MNKNEFLDFIKTVDSVGKDLELSSFVEEVFGLLDHWINLSDSYHIESSFNSIEREKVIKVIQVFKFDRPDKNGLVNILDLQPLKAYLKKINRRQGSDFKADFIGKFSGMKMYTRKDNDFISVNFDFNAVSKKVEKISVYFNPELEPFKKIFDSSIVSPSEFGNDLELVGVDFSNDGKIFLKTYRKYEENCKMIKGDIGKEKADIIGAISNLGKKYDYRFMLLLDKTEIGKKEWKFGGCYLYCENDAILASVGKNIELTSEQKDLVDSTGKMIMSRDLHISFFVFKPEDVLEIYFL